MSARSLCPICRERRATPEHQPFCGARCREIDMGRWLTGAYRVPADEPVSIDAADGADDPPAE